MVAGLFASALIVAIAPAIGWPRATYPIDALVVSSRPVGERVHVAFAGRAEGRLHAWARDLDDSEWRVGSVRRHHVGDDGRIYLDSPFDFAGTRLIFYWFMLGVFIVFAVRRAVGLWIARQDLRRSSHPPRFGFVALIHDPTPRMWRPLLAVWRVDPTDTDRRPKPDGVYRADDETDEHLQSWQEVTVREAWIDGGRFSFSKPRWVGVEEGIVIPHRRSLFGRRYFHLITRRWKRGGPVPLDHGPPHPASTTAFQPPTAVHRFAAMLVWRAIFALVLLGMVTLISLDEGEEMRTIDSPKQVGSVAWSLLERDLGPPETIDLSEDISELAVMQGFDGAFSTAWTEGTDRVTVERWRFVSAEDARLVAEAELALWLLAGEERDGEVVARLEEGTLGAVRVFPAGQDVVKVLISGDDPDLDRLEAVVRELPTE